MKASLLAPALLILLSGCATAALPRAEPGWTCASGSSGDGIDVRAIRTLDGFGRQRDVGVQWTVGGFDRGRLVLSAIQKSPGAGDPRTAPKELLISWSGFPGRTLKQRLLIVLHPAGDVPNPLDGTAMIPYMDGLVGAVISWQRIKALARGSPAAQISLIEPDGRVLRSAPVDLRRLAGLRQRVRLALDDSRAKAATFRKSCEPVAERSAP